jgi:hypothetical protein
MKKTVKKLVLVTVLVAAAMTLPSKSEAAKFCDYIYFYDAAHTQFAAFCNYSCYAGGNICQFGEPTEYFVLDNCSNSCNN